MQGYNFTLSLKARMEFQNPYILDAVVQQFAIDEIGEHDCTWKLTNARFADRYWQLT